MKKRCSVCGSEMTRFVTGWKCMNVKAHAQAKQRGIVKRRGQVRNPQGIHGPPQKKTCPVCRNRRNLRKKCMLCNGKGWIMGH